MRYVIYLPIMKIIKKKSIDTNKFLTYPIENSIH